MEESTVHNEIYVPLKPSSFRILHLHPGQPADELKCTLQTTPLTSPAAAPYSALSYVWGAPLPRMPLRLNTYAITINLNLSSALHQIRSPTETKSLWIDALCINQSSISERSSQVQLMRQIYHSAAKVLIWLGPAEEEHKIPEAFELLNLAVKASREENPEDKLDVGDMPEVTWSVAKNAEHGFPERGSTDWYPLGFLLGRPWFRRMWIVQEAASSVDSVVMCGGYETKWWELLVGVYWLDKYGYTRTVFGWAVMAPFVLIWQALNTEVRSTLLRLMYMAQLGGFRCTDLKDRVFALLGLSSEGVDVTKTCRLLIPDYGLRIEEIYVNLVKHYLECDHHSDINAYGKEKDKNNLEILATIRHTEETLSPSAAFPSWIPQPMIAKGGFLYPTAKSSRDLPIQLKEPITGKTLILRGIYISTVTAVDSRISSDAGFTKGEIFMTSKYIKSMWKTYGLPLISEEELGSFDKVAQAFVDAITEKIVYDGRARTAEDLRAFLAHNAEEEGWQRVKEDTAVLGKMGDALPFLASVRDGSFLMTDDLMMARGPFATRPGDRICVLFGGNTPFLVRPIDGEEGYRFVGSCYLADIMDGQAIEALGSGKRVAEWFELR